MNQAEQPLFPDSDIRNRILDWSGPVFPLSIRNEAALIYYDYDRGRITDEVDFYTSELKFGTGGLRGVIGNGPGRMNRWTVGKSTLGFVRYILKHYKNPSMVIAFDSRRMSREFAATTAGIAAGLGVKVYLFEDVTPTPVLSYAIRYLKASGGVVITASHNPPEYNGYKVYLDDGSQLVGSPQKEIESEIAAVTDWGEIAFLDENDPSYKKNVEMVGPEILKAYIGEFKKQIFVTSADKKKRPLKLVYSPLHGTGSRWLTPLLQAYGVDVVLVEEQAEPDGEFPTVRYPNPEEPEALKLAEEKAKSVHADIFIATDPDADRLGAGILNKAGEYVLINGNQLGSVMAAYMCEKAEEFRKRDDSIRYHLVKTIVTTNLQKEIALRNDVQIHNTLTGFKYIAQQMKFMDDGEHGFVAGVDRFLFGGEESYGYLPVDFVRDKDSLASALLLAEIFQDKGDILDYLDQVYLNYGLYLEILKSVTLKGPGGKQKIQETMTKLRSEDLSRWEFGGRTVAYALDYKNRTKNGEPSPDDFHGLPEEEVIQLVLEPEGVLTIRPSGTEPKVKLYASLRHPVDPQSLDELARKKDELQNELATITGIFFARTGLSG